MSFYSRNKAKLENTLHSLKAIFGAPAQESAHGALLNPSQAEFSLLNARYEEWVNDAYKRNEVVAGALNLIVDTLVEAPLGVQDASGEWIEEGNDVLKLFQHINDETTQLQFLKELYFHLFLGSVAFIEKVRANNGKVTEIGLLRPDKVQLKTGTRGIEYYTYFPTTAPIRVEEQNIVFLKFLDPLNKYKGHSPLHSLATRIDTENEHTTLKFNALKNGGVPGTIIKFEGHSSDDEKRAASKGFSNRFSGKSNGSVLAIDEGIVDISPFGSSIADLDSSSLMNVDEARILSTLKIPLQVYGSLSGQSASTMDNMKASLRMFWMHGLIPLQTMLEDFINNDPDLTEDFKYKIKFDRRNIDALNADLDSVATRAREDYKFDVRTLNEARQASGLEALEGGDEIRQTAPNPFEGFSSMLGGTSNEKTMQAFKNLEEKYESNLQAFEEWKEDESFDTIPTDSVSDSKSRDENEASINKETDELITNDRDLLSEFKTASSRFRLADSAALPLVRMVDAELRKEIKEFQAVIGDKQGKALKTFESTRLTDELQILQNEWEIRLHAESLPLMTKLIEETAKQASASVGATFDIESEAIQQAIKAEQFKFANRVSNSSAKQIRQVIKASFDEGLSLGETSKAIGDLGSVWQNGGRADTIARTETAKAANGGAKLAYREAGVTKLRYTAVLDDNTTEICKALDGKIVGIEEKFLSAEEGFVSSEGKASDLSYNDGVPNAGDAHPNCRSTIVPVFESTDGGF